MRKDVIPVEDAQGGPRSPRRFLRLLALLLAAFALLSAVWYFTAYRPYDVYMEALRAQPGWREAPALPGCGTDGEGYNCNVARPGFLHWTGNLGIGMPNLTLENGEEVGFTDSLLIWPRMTGFTDTKKRQYKLYRNVRNLRLGDQVQNRMQIRISDAGD